jgi:RNA polymerase sigma-70 factor (ECF subfamily)
MASRERDTELGGEGRAFPATRHTALSELASGEPARRRAAADALVRAYWKPCYAYARLAHRLGNDDAKELVQGFFARALEQGLFERFDPSRGRLRTFLRACLDHHVLHEREKAAREKRGGGARPVALDPELHDVAAAAPTPEEELEARFRAECVRHLLGLAVEAVRARAEELGKPAAFAAFRRYDLHDGPPEARPSYAAIAAELGLPVTQVTNHLHWARKELRARLTGELRALVRDEAELAEEFRALFGAEPG